MADKLKPGTGNVSEEESFESLFSGSMAQAIEGAFREEWSNFMDGETPEPSQELRLFFVAVARGVVKHLKDNPRAFKIISGGDGSATWEGYVSRIETE